MEKKRSPSLRRVEPSSDHESSRAVGSELGPDEVQDEVVDIVVAQIKRLTRTAGLEFALRVGAVIVHHFYDGDAAAWRARGPRATSFRRLAQRPDLPLSSAALCRCVAMFELCNRLNAPSRWDHLGASHLRLVLGLPPDEQEKILSIANAQRWTVKVLEQHVLRRKGHSRSSGGRRPSAPVIKGLTALTRSLENYEEVLIRSEPLSPRDIEQSALLIARTRIVLDRLAQCVDRDSNTAATDELYPPLSTARR
jgi:hypothetical protein